MIKRDEKDVPPVAQQSIPGANVSKREQFRTRLKFGATSAATLDVECGFHRRVERHRGLVPGNQGRLSDGLAGSQPW
jgi:hypothetical protein